jgi:hypothetical protein
MSVSTCMTTANILLLAALVCFYIHAYWHNTVDFVHYRARLAFPVVNVLMKYLYANSFLLFAACTILFIAGVGIATTQIANATFAWCWLGFSAVLLAGSTRLLLMKPIGQWPRRAG